MRGGGLKNKQDHKTQNSKWGQRDLGGLLQAPERLTEHENNFYLANLLVWLLDDIHPQPATQTPSCSSHCSINSVVKHVLSCQVDMLKVDMLLSDFPTLSVPLSPRPIGSHWRQKSLKYIHSKKDNVFSKAALQARGYAVSAHREFIVGLSVVQHLSSI